MRWSYAEKRVLEMLCEDHHTVASLQHALKGAPGWSQRVIVCTLEMFARNELIEAFVVDPETRAYVPIVDLGEVPDMLTVHFRATEAGCRDAGYSDGDW